MNKKQKRLGNKGFSLVELIVVIAIMAVLVAVLAPTLIGKIEESRESSDLSTVTEIKTQVSNMLSNEEFYNTLVGSAVQTYSLNKDTLALSAETGTPNLSEVNKELANVLEPFKFQSKQARNGAVVKVRISEKGKVYVFVAASGTPTAPITLSNGETLSSGNVINVAGETPTEAPTSAETPS